MLLKSALVLIVLFEFTVGLGYLINGEYFPVPQGAEFIIEGPNAPVANSPLDDSNQLKRDVRNAAWRNIGLGKKRSAFNKQRSWAMIGLGKK